MSRLRVLGALMVVALMASACAEGLAFVKDDRVEIVAPKGHTKVSLPVTIDWEVEDFDGYFALFVNTTPVPPGKTLEWIARDDQTCLNTPGCPDRTYFADRGVYSTTETSVTLERLPDRDAYQGHETHEVTVILLDGTGRRLTESAWHVTFFYDREV
ncbi:MAG TPA: hypothetical protein VNP73_03675 [Actinomycetota bacterium]|nr:hypothetical protein [Actinomycetota bacterium]